MSNSLRFYFRYTAFFKTRPLLVVCCFVLALCPFASLAQHEADNWYFGTNAGISFNPAPRALTNGMLFTDEGCAAVSDKNTGALLFYTDGVRVWNRNHQVMPNGTGLEGHSTSTQSAIIVPHPGISGQYYIFTPGSTIQNNIVSERLVYSIVDMSLNNGLGDVISKNSLLINSGISEKVAATIDCSGEGYWLLAHHHSQPVFYAFKIDDSGINTASVVSEVGEFTGQLDYMIGQMKFSPNGRKIAVASHHPTVATRGGFELFDFNFTTGVVSSPVTLQSGENYYGASFSPNSSKLYGFSAGATPRISQYNVALTTPDEIINSRRYMTTNMTYTGALQLAPNYQIIIPRGNAVWAIDSPDESTGSRITNFLLLSNRQTQYSLPGFIDHLFIRGKKGLTCAAPIAQFSGSTIVCEGRYANFSDDSDNFPTSWTWSFPGGEPGSYEGKTPPPILYEERGVYTVTLTTTNDHGTSTKELTVLVVPVPSPVVIKDTSVCEGRAINIGGAGESGVSYLWTPKDFLDSRFSPNPSATFTTPGTYQYIVEARRANDCIAYDTVNITVHPKPVADAGRDTSSCIAAAFTIGVPGTAGELYEWNPKTGLANPFASRTLANVTQTTTYTLTVTNQHGCSVNDVVTVTIKGLPKVFKENTVKICLGSKIRIGMDSEPGILYQWSPSAGLSDTKIANPLASPTVTTTYRLRATDTAGNCSNESLVTVEVGNVEGTASPDTTICEGASVQLWANGGTSYHWSPDIGLSGTAIPNPIASPPVSMIYTVFISDGQCSDTAFVKVYVRKINGNIAGRDITLCEGSVGQIGTAPKAGVEYKWFPEAGLSSPFSAEPFVYSDQLPENPMRYIVTAHFKDDAECITTDTVFVKTGDIEAKVTADTTICRGTSVELTAEGGSEYTWSPATGLSSATGASVIATPETTTRYFVIASSGACRDTAEVTVTVTDMPSAFAGPDKIICLGESVTIGESAKPGISYTWTPEKNLSDATAANPTATPEVTTQFIIEAKSETGCIAWDTVVVQVGELLSVDAGSDAKICEGEETQLQAVGSQENLQYRWVPEAGLSNSQIPDPIASPSITTMYYVSVTRENGLCTAIDSVLVTVFKNPVLTASDITLCPGESAVLKTESNQEGLSYSWSPAEGLDRTDISNPVVTAATSTTYTVTATSPEGCSATHEVNVFVNSKDVLLTTVNVAKDSIEPGDNTEIDVSIQYSGETPIRSFKGSFVYDASVFVFDQDNDVLLQGADATWAVSAVVIQPGLLYVEAAGQTPLKGLTFTVKLGAYLARQTLDSITFSVTEVNSGPVEQSACLTLQSNGAPVFLKDVCGGDMRLVAISDRQYALRQNTPNPAGAETEIGYSIGLAGNAALILYNSMGEQESVLKNNFHEPGAYFLKIPTTDLPSGLYYYRLISGPYTAILPMMIAK